MSTRKTDPATVALDLRALEALRRTSRVDAPSTASSASAPVSEDAPTQLYLRARRAPSALFHTMTVRAVAALGSASSHSRHVAQLGRRARKHSRRRMRWRLALAGLACACCIAALVGATALLLRAPNPPQPAPHLPTPQPFAQPAPQPPAPPQLNQPTRVPADPVPARTPPPVAAAAHDSPPIALALPARRARPKPSSARAVRTTSRSMAITPRSAADALARGDFATALARYRELSARQPDQPVFAAIARLLERDRARRCASLDDATDATCAP